MYEIEFSKEAVKHVLANRMTSVHRITVQKESKYLFFNVETNDFLADDKKVKIFSYKY